MHSKHTIKNVRILTSSTILKISTFHFRTQICEIYSCVVSYTSFKRSKTNEYGPYGQYESFELDQLPTIDIVYESGGEMTQIEMRLPPQVATQRARPFPMYAFTQIETLLLTKWSKKKVEIFKNRSSLQVNLIKLLKFSGWKIHSHNFLFFNSPPIL